MYCTAISIWESIIIGGAGGAIAGITVFLIQQLHSYLKFRKESMMVYDWLVKNCENIKGKEYRTTRTISSWTNLTEDRVRYLCSKNKKIRLSTGPEEDRWTTLERNQ